MKFTPEKYLIPDQRLQAFIDTEEIENLLNNAISTPELVDQIIRKSLNKKRLTLQDTAILLKAEDEASIQNIKDGARTLKETIYGNRIVLFAPLYVGNKCLNNCEYCGFRASNKEAIRKTLSDDELIKEVEALEDNGQKRLILVYGEHPEYSPEYIAHTVKTVYGVKKGNGEIRRVNINAAPLSIEGFKTVKESGIGTYQVFQETYHPEAYKKYHLGGAKRDYENRLTSLDRAMEAGIDDVGIGALFGLYDWRFEVMGLLRHVNHLEACYNVGPHTISFPRIQDASTFKQDPKYKVSNEDFTKLVAILRLAVPYTGLILTAREPEVVRKEAMHFGVSQIDGGTKIELGEYNNKVDGNVQNLNREQFKINDDRSLNQVVDELLDDNFLPSFCTACYRLGRTGEHFMEFSVPGFIKRFCSANAMLTLAEYIMDYASPSTAEKGWKVIEKNLVDLAKFQNTDELKERIERVKQGERDMYF